MEFLKRLSIYYLVIIFLISLLFLGTLSFGLSAVLFQAIPPILAATAIDSLIKYFRLKSWHFSLSALITGLIVGLTAEFGASPLTLAFIAICAILAKFIIRWDGKHIFNPAGAGLLIGMLTVHSAPSWWGGSGYPWVFLIWLPILIYKLKRWAPIVGFIVPAILSSGVGILTSGSALFFMSVMLIEPKTSPFQTKLGLIYGFIVGIVYLIFNFQFSPFDFAQGKIFNSFDPFIPSLLIANLGARLLAKVIV